MAGGATVRPLFIPLKTEYFQAFADGSKREELRRYGPRWNERTCCVGRDVVLSKGYSKQARKAIWANMEVQCPYQRKRQGRKSELIVYDLENSKRFWQIMCLICWLAGITIGTLFGFFYTAGVLNG